MRRWASRTSRSLDHPAQRPWGNSELRPDSLQPQSWDLVVAGALIVLAATLASTVPEGNPWRSLPTLAILLTVPGYLLVEAALAPGRPRDARGRHILVGVGISPVVVGLLALATATVDGGFRAGSIVAAVTAGCLLLAATAFARRSRQPPRDAPVQGAPRQA